jgi:Na+/phosphate symporter
MLFAPPLRKLTLTAHVSTSVGWAGAVACFLALSIAGVGSQDAQLVRTAYLAMHLITWWVIVPLCVAALITGVVQSAGTTWGLLRHYWVAAKLLLTATATIILLAHTQPIAAVAALAATSTLSSNDLWQLRFQLVGDASAALFVLFITTALSVYKPWGLTPFGVRKLRDATPAWRPTLRQPSRTRRYIVAAVLAFVLVLLLIHLAGVSH